MSSRCFGATLWHTNRLRPPLVQEQRPLAGQAHLKEKLPKADQQKTSDRLTRKSLLSGQDQFRAAQARANPDFEGSLHYHRIDVTDDANTEAIVVASVKYIASAVDHSSEQVGNVVRINYTGVFTSASEVGEEIHSVIHANCLCPGHIETPMAQMVMERDPKTKKLWELENMMKWLAKSDEFRGVTLLLMSDASSFMSASTVVL
ncbi:hypothetical protein BDW59DRAFT_175347 [Aspergillus cavernicola]|uniref:Uncharacterized protein n=1 Tax=Aspergillus cavernicola TaxID=176166 RepID=A0ABR4HRE1_9EURO